MHLEINVSKTAAEWLVQRAKDAGIDEAAVAARILQEAAERDLDSAATRDANGIVGSGEELDALLNAFFVQNPTKLPSLPDDFSRDDIYADHD